MNSSQVGDVHEAVPCLKSIQPTKWGGITLSIFPQEAIEWADDNFARSPSKADAFKKFTNLCVEWCSQQGIKPNWRSMYERQRLEQMPTFAPMIHPSSPKVPEAGGSYYALGGTPLVASKDRRSATSPGRRTTPPLAEGQVLISGSRYRVLSATETQERQSAFVTNQEAVAGIDKLAMLLGKSTASDYFKRVFENLKYEEIRD